MHQYQAHSQDFQKGGYVHRCMMCMYACKHGRLGGSGACLEIRCSEIASEVILGQKQIRIVAAWLADYCIYSIYLFAKPADIKFPRKIVLRLAQHQVG